MTIRDVLSISAEQPERALDRVEFCFFSSNTLALMELRVGFISLLPYCRSVTQPLLSIESSFLTHEEAKIRRKAARCMFIIGDYVGGAGSLNAHPIPS